MKERKERRKRGDEGSVRRREEEKWARISLRRKGNGLE